ncbi:hypothetical protein TNCV_3424751 [Trichonephila clavipes]|nr:hypothetical protein TNCV_3424751 [Trichonephila clavipes]
MGTRHPFRWGKRRTQKIPFLVNNNRADIKITVAIPGDRRPPIITKTIDEHFELLGKNQVITTRPRNCYAKVSPRLGRSRHRFSPFETWTALRDQESEAGFKEFEVCLKSADFTAGKMVFLRGLLSPIRVVELTIWRMTEDFWCLWARRFSECEAEPLLIECTFSLLVITEIKENRDK